MQHPHLLSGIIKQHHATATLVSLYRDYHQGKHTLRFASDDFKAKYRRQVEQLRENLCPGIIDAFTDRIALESWTATHSSVIDTEGLTRLVAHLADEAWLTGNAYTLVWPSQDGTPVPHFHRADQIVPHVNPNRPGVLDWAAKVWIDDTKHGRVNIYDTEKVERYTTTRPLAEGDATLPTGTASWGPYRDDEAAETIPHGFNAVPVVWLKTGAPDQNSPGRSILTEVIPLQDALNKALVDGIVNQEAYSRPFWYLLNYKPQSSGLAAAGEYMSTVARILSGAAQRRFNPTRQQIFTHDGPGPVGQLDPADITHLIKVQDAYALKAARVVGIPPYYITQTSGDVPSGESLRTLTARLVARVRRWQRFNTPALRGLAQLLGIENPVISWAQPAELDILEAWRVAQIKQGLGLALVDVLNGLGLADIDDIVERAAAAKSRDTAAMGQALRDGLIDYET